MKTIFVQKVQVFSYKHAKRIGLVVDFVNGRPELSFNFILDPRWTYGLIVWC
ncbi:MAG: hypothetical protein ACXVCP_11175 [Bdellovibrio sp.]